MSRVLVYRNLTKNCWSVMVKGRVVKHTTSLTMRDCTFKVREGGRQRVLREKKKFVHAFVSGEIVEDPILVTSSVQVAYNPYRGPHFHEKASGQTVFAAPALILTSEGNVFSVN